VYLTDIPATEFIPAGAGCFVGATCSTDMSPVAGLFQQTAQEQFLNGYSDGDSIYDNI
jgi:hypothetical protein